MSPGTAPPDLTMAGQKGNTMYRSYENPFTLEDRLEELRNEFCERVEAGATWDELGELQYDIAELEERINHAWQDDEYDSNY